MSNSSPKSRKRGKSKSRKGSGPRLNRASKSKKESKQKSRTRQRGEREMRPLFTGWSGWYLRVGVAITASVFFIAVLEFGLFIGGIGHASDFFVPTQDKGVLTTNKRYVELRHLGSIVRPHPIRVSQVKPSGTIRIFIFGESAAMGTPDPYFGFGKILKDMLEKNFPNNRVEVINVAMRGINSHFIGSISRDCAKLNPDLFIVYMGNNEACGQYGPESFLGQHSALIPVVHRVNRSRIGQLLNSGIQKNGGPPQEKTQSMEYFREHKILPDDPKSQAVFSNYRDNLKQICENGDRAGVLVLTVAANLRDFPPLGSMHGNDLTGQQLQEWESIYREGIEYENKKDAEEAIASYLEATAIDDHYAELHFRLGRCYLAIGKLKEARNHFILARDWDAIQFRTSSRLNEIAREVAAGNTGKKVYLVDTEKAIAESELCRDGIGGSEFFYDHVHFSFDGDYELAKAILPEAIGVLKQDRGLSPAKSLVIPSRSECAKRLAFTPWDEINCRAGIADMTARPPFLDQLDHELSQSHIQDKIKQFMSGIDQSTIDTVFQTYDNAINANSDDWNLRYNYSRLLYTVKRYGETARQMEYVVTTFPSEISFRMLYAHALLGSSSIDQAISHYRKVLEYDASYKPAQQALDRALQIKNTPQSLMLPR